MWHGWCPSAHRRGASVRGSRRAWATLVVRAPEPPVSWMYVSRMSFVGSRSGRAHSSSAGCLASGGAPGNSASAPRGGSCSVPGLCSARYGAPGGAQPETHLSLLRLSRDPALGVRLLPSLPVPLGNSGRNSHPILVYCPLSVPLGTSHPIPDLSFAIRLKRADPGWKRIRVGGRRGFSGTCGARATAAKGGRPRCAGSGGSG